MDKINDYIEATKGRQFSYEEIEFILNNVNWPVNLLVFGGGYDAKIWAEANKKGKTTIIEDNPEMVDMIKVKWGLGINVQLVEYWTHNTDYKRNLGKKELILKKAGNPDVIIVDGPFGFGPGRSQSISTAHYLWNDFRCEKVFVHDCNREQEIFYCDQLWGSHEFRGIQKLRLYE